MSSISKYYKILGLDTTASAVEVKTAYRNLAKKWHPDRFVNVPEQLKQAEQEIQKINEAYEFIKNNIEDTINSDGSSKISIETIDASYYYNLGVQLAEKEDYQNAIANFSQAIKLDNSYIKAYQYRGFIFSKLGYEHRADADFRKVTEIKLKSKTTSKKSSYNNNPNNSYSNKEVTTKNKKPSYTYKPNYHEGSSNCIHYILAHKKLVSSIVVSKDNRLLITGSYDRTIKVCNFSMGQIIDTLQGHSKGITCLAISDDGKTLISGSLDKNIRFWDLKKRKTIKIIGGLFSGHTNAIVSLVFDSRNNILISAGEDKVIKIWDLKTNREIQNINCTSGQITDLAINRDLGYFCNSGWEKQLRIRDIKTGKVIRSLRGTSGVTALSFSNDGNLLATGEINHKIRVFDLTTGKIIKTFTGHTDRVSSLIFSSDSKQLISGGWDKKIKLWDIEKEIELKTLGTHQDRVLSLAVGSNGKIISGSKDGTIKVWQSNK